MPARCLSKPSERMTFITRPRRDTAALAKRRIDKGWHTASLQVLVDQQVFKTCHAAWSFFVMSAPLASTSRCASSAIAMLAAMALAHHPRLSDYAKAETRRAAPQETQQTYKCGRSLPSPKVSQLRGDCWEPNWWGCTHSRFRHQMRMCIDQSLHMQMIRPPTARYICSSGGGVRGAEAGGWRWIL